MPSTRRVFIFANCQGRGVQLFLTPILERHFPVEFLCVENYKMLNNDEEIIKHREFIKNADVYIYQPVKAIREDCSVKYSVPKLIDEFLPGNCERISFPYIYNNAFWPFVVEGNKCFTSDTVLQMVEAEGNLDRVLRLYDDGVMDFSFFERFIRTSSILREKEAICDVKISTFIERNYKDNMLFLTQNHPTSVVFLECVGQIYRIMGERGLLVPDMGSLLPMFRGVPFNITGLPGYWPTDKYARGFFRYSWANHFDGNAAEFYRGILTAMWNTTHSRNVR